MPGWDPAGSTQDTRSACNNRFTEACVTIEQEPKVEESAAGHEVVLGWCFTGSKRFLIQTVWELSTQGKDEPSHDKTNKVTVRPAKTRISLGICPVWSESSLSIWRNHGSLAIYWAHSEDSDQTGRMPRLIWVFAGCTLILLVLSCRGSDKDERLKLYTTVKLWKKSSQENAVIILKFNNMVKLP